MIKFKTILNVSIVAIASALAWAYIAFSDLLSRIYYDTASLLYIIIMSYVIMAMLSAVFLLCDILGHKII